MTSQNLFYTSRSLISTRWQQELVLHASPRARSHRPWSPQRRGRSPWARMLRLLHPRALLSLFSLIAYAILDLYWALYSRSWPLTLLFYLPCCIPLELAFWIQVRRYVRERSRASNNAFREPEDVREAQRVWELLIDDEKPESVVWILRSWFLGEGEPHADDVLALVSLTTFNRPVSDLEPNEVRWVRAVLGALERVTGRRFAPGSHPGLRSMAWLALEELEPCYKPLAFYLFTQTCHGLCAALLRVLGFERREALGGRIKYWCRPPVRTAQDGAADATRAAASPHPHQAHHPQHARRARLLHSHGTATAMQPSLPPPLVFLHGVGGLVPYWIALIIFSFRHKGALLVPTFPHCSVESLPVLASAPKPLQADELVAALREMLRSVGTHRKAAFFAHSFGTGALGIILKAAPDLAASVTFVDPICFCFSGTVAKNFLYSTADGAAGEPLRGEPPRADASDAGDADDWDDASSVSSRTSVTRLIQRKMASEEPTIQDAFRRKFWWAQMWIHPTDLPCDAHVILSGCDTVSSAAEVRRHLLDYESRREVAAPRVSLEYHSAWRHGWLLLAPYSLVLTVDTLCERAARTADADRHEKRSDGGRAGAHANAAAAAGVGLFRAASPVGSTGELRTTQPSPTPSTGTTDAAEGASPPVLLPSTWAGSRHVSFELTSAIGFRRHEKRNSKERCAEEELTETASMASSVFTNE